jgi:hypothetical protein
MVLAAVGTLTDTSLLRIFLRFQAKFKSKISNYFVYDFIVKRQTRLF